MISIYGSTKDRGQHWEETPPVFAWTMDSVTSLRRFIPSVVQWPFDLVMIHFTLFTWL